MELSEKKLLQIRVTSFAILLTSIVGVLSLYYLKYLPEKQNEYHRGAFRELAQIQQALKARNTGYLQAINNYTRDQKEMNLDLLNNFFANNGFASMEKGVNSKGSYKVDQPILTQEELSREWQLTYIVHPDSAEACSKIVGLSKNLNTVLDQLVANYKDIFNDFILIRVKSFDNSSLSVFDSCYLDIKPKKNDADGQTHTKKNDNLNPDIIIYNSGNLPLDYKVKTDSLFKNSDGFSMLNVKNVTIQGNPYKLFLYPFQLGKERIILSGLVTRENYSAGYKNIPLGYITFIAFLILLLVIYLPILKVFKLGKLERTRAMDIRLLIATYFIGAFVVFFLLFKLFLDKNQSHRTLSDLQEISDSVQSNFKSEILSACRQLKDFDDSVNELSPKKNINLLTKLFSYEMVNEKLKINSNSSDSLTLNSVFNPETYPNLDQLFWIDSSGVSKAIRAYKKNYGTTPFVNVRDRQYFIDFIQKRSLSIEDQSNKQKFTFTIQPTLDKLDGEYIINVIMRSSEQNKKIWDSIFNSGLFLEHQSSPPISFIGLSAKMYSVCNPILPPGYNFSIVNNDGLILYDSKPGRVLLSNFFDGIENPAKLSQGIRYRVSMFMDHLTLRGREVSMLSRPIKNFPYSLIVYYKNADADSYEEHLISVTAFCTLLCLALVLSSGILNEFLKRRRSLLQMPVVNFDWLYPLRKKQLYYRHLVIYMLALFFLYSLAWVAATFNYPRFEFPMFFVTLLFPFFIAIFYFFMKKGYYNKEISISRKPENNIQFRSLMFYLGAIILAINFLYLFGEPNKGTFIFLLLFQIIAAALIAHSRITFANLRSFDEHAYLRKLRNVILRRSSKRNTWFSRYFGATLKLFYKKDIYLRYYIMAILIGVFMISIVPAAGIFCLIFRQERSLELNNDQLYLARSIQSRSLEINKRNDSYRHSSNRRSDSIALDGLKFHHGIYTLNKVSVVSQKPVAEQMNLDITSIAPAYARLHSLFFPEDSVTLSGQRSQYIANDWSWYFRQIEKDKHDSLRLVYENLQDGYATDSIRLNLDPIENYSSIQLLTKRITCLTSSPFLFLLITFVAFLLVSVALYYLTKSMALRLFLIDLRLIYHRNKKHNDHNTSLEENYFFMQIAKRYAHDEQLQSNLKLPLPLNLNSIYEYETKALITYKDEKVFYMKELMKFFYEQIWKGLDKTQKFILYDFAEDGFTNYKADYILLGLLNQGIIKFEDQRLSLMTPSFREYILQMSDDKDVVQNIEKAKKQDYWKIIKTPLLLLLTGIGIFIFVSQQETYQKITGILTTLCTVIPLISSLFNLKNGNGSAANKEKDKGKKEKRDNE